jgi:uncharacterized membrane-anchored protein YjiN (DUF445 family)
MPLLSQSPATRVESLYGSKQAALYRMKVMAAALLAAMLITLVLATAFTPTYPALHWVRAFCEAAAVGAVADWFAVVALFRQPLGLPIPHTAIIPRNKNRIGESLGVFIQHNFLTPAHVVRKLKERNLAAALGRWLTVPVNSKSVAHSACALVPGMLNALRDDDVARLFDRAVFPGLERVDLAGAAGNLLDLLTAHGRSQELLERALMPIEDWIVAHRDFLLQKFGETSKYTPEFVDRYIVDRLVAGVVRLLHETAQDPQHELRLQFDLGLRNFIEKLKTSPEYKARAEELKRDLLARLQQQAVYRELWSALESRLWADLESEHSALREQATRFFVGMGESLLLDAPLRDKVNAWLIRTIEDLMLRHGHQVSLLIAEVVRDWDAEQVAEKIESEIGKDLQFIRINGTIVGGVAGVVLHALTGALV